MGCRCSAAVTSRGARARAHIAVAPGSALFGVLRDSVTFTRVVLIAGLPATGKSLLTQESARIALDIGRRVHLLQWDVARLPFDRPDILARYPEVDGVTHPAIRIAAGRWARRAVARWHAAHPDPVHLLIAETPLAGERFMALARPSDDAIEPLLASDATLALIPVPSREVRRVIEDARARDMAVPVRPGERSSAPPHLVDAHWLELERVADTLGIVVPGLRGTYDPDLYATVFRRALRHRRTIEVPITRVLEVDPEVEPPVGATDIVPSAAEVDDALAEQEARPADETRRVTEEWYRV